MKENKGLKIALIIIGVIFLGATESANYIIGDKPI